MVFLKVNIFYIKYITIISEEPLIYTFTIVFMCIITVYILALPINTSPG